MYLHQPKRDSLWNDFLLSPWPPLFFFYFFFFFFFAGPEPSVSVSSNAPKLPDPDISSTNVPLSCFRILTDLRRSFCLRVGSFERELLPYASPLVRPFVFVFAKKETSHNLPGKILESPQFS